MLAGQPAVTGAETVGLSAVLCILKGLLTMGLVESGKASLLVEFSCYA